MIEINSKIFQVSNILLLLSIFGTSSYVFSNASQNDPRNQWSKAKVIQISSSQSFAPKISPKEQTVFFVSDIDSNLNLYKKKLSGGSPQQITFHPAFDSEGIPSSNGKSLIWVSKREDALGDIHIMKLGFNVFQFGQTSKDKNSLQLKRPNTSESNPVWLENSKEFLFLSKRNEDPLPTLWKANLNDLKAVQIVNHPMDSYSVDPKGEHLVFFNQQSIYYVDLSQNDSTSKVLSTSPKWITQPFITEDLNYLYFTQYAYDTNQDKIFDDKDYPTIWRLPFIQNKFFHNCKEELLKCMEPVTSSDFEASNPFVDKEILYFTGNHNHQWLSLQSLPKNGHINSDTSSKENFLDEMKNTKPGPQKYYVARKYLANSIQRKQPELIAYYTNWARTTDPNFEWDPSLDPNLSLGEAIKELENSEKDNFYHCFLRYYTAKNFLKRNNFQAAAIFFEQSSTCEDISVEISTQSIEQLIRLGLSETFIRKSQNSPNSFIFQFTHLLNLKRQPLKNLELEKHFQMFTRPEIKIDYLTWVYKTAPKHSLETIYNISKTFNTTDAPRYIHEQFSELLDKLLVSLAEYYLNMSETKHSLQILSKLIAENPLHLMARKMQLDLYHSINQIENQIQYLKEDSIAYPNNTERAFFLAYAKYLSSQNLSDLYLKMEEIKELHVFASNLIQRNNQMAIYQWFYAKLSLELNQLQTTLIKQRSFSAFSFYRGKILKNFFGFEDQNLILEAIESAKTSILLNANKEADLESRIILADALYEISSYSSSLKEYLQLIQNNFLNRKNMSHKISEISLKASRSAYMSEEFLIAIALQKNLLSKINYNEPNQIATYIRALERLSLYQYANQDYESSIQHLKQILDDPQLSNSLEPSHEMRLRIILASNLYLRGKFQACIDVLSHESGIELKQNKTMNPYVFTMNDLELIRIKLIRKSYEQLKDFKRSLDIHSKEISLIEESLKLAKSTKQPQIKFDLLLSKHQEINILYKMGDLSTANIKMETLNHLAQEEDLNLASLKDWQTFKEEMKNNFAFLKLRASQQGIDTIFEKNDFESISSLDSFKFLKDLQKAILSSKQSIKEQDLNFVADMRAKRQSMLNSDATLGVFEGISSAHIPCTERLLYVLSRKDNAKPQSLNYDLKYCFQRSFPEIIKHKSFLELLNLYIEHRSTSEISSINLDGFLKELKPEEILLVDISNSKVQMSKRFLLISKNRNTILASSTQEINEALETWQQVESISNPRVAILNLQGNSNSSTYNDLSKQNKIRFLSANNLDSLLDELQKADSYFKLALEKDEEIATKMNQFPCYKAKHDPQQFKQIQNHTLTIKMRMLRNVFDFIYACPDKVSEVTDFIKSIESFDLRPHEPWAEKVLAIIHFELSCLKSECSESNITRFIESLQTQTENKGPNEFYVQIALRFLNRNQKIETTSIQQYQRYRTIAGDSQSTRDQEPTQDQDCGFELKRTESITHYFKCLQHTRMESRKLGFKKEWFIRMQEEITWSKHRKRIDLEFILNNLLIEDYIYAQEYNLASKLIETNLGLQANANLSLYGLNTLLLKNANANLSGQLFFHPYYFEKLILIFILKTSSYETRKTQFTESWNKLLDPTTLSLLEAKNFVHRFEVMNHTVTLSSFNGNLDTWDVYDNQDIDIHSPGQNNISANSDRYSKFFEKKDIQYLFYESEKLLQTFKTPSYIVLKSTDSFSHTKLNFNIFCLKAEDIEFGEPLLKLLNRRYGELPFETCKIQNARSLRIRIDSQLSTKKKIEQIRSFYSKLRLVKTNDDGYDLNTLRNTVQPNEGLFIDSSGRF